MIRLLTKSNARDGVRATGKEDRVRCLLFALTVAALAMFMLFRNDYVSAGTLNKLAIVEDGAAKAVVVVSVYADTEAMRTAELLTDYVERATSVVLSIVPEDQLPPSGGEDAPNLLYVGDGFALNDPHLAHEVAQLGEHGFILHFHGNRLHIVGPTVWGTRNGVLEFLERYADIRWLFPGADGEDVPELTELLIPNEDVRQSPALDFRVISPYFGDPNAVSNTQALFQWARNNRLQGRYNWNIYFGHNLHSLFPPAVYGASNPEFYPNGQPPAATAKAGWQPCFSEPATVGVAVSGILDYFQQNPDQQVFSLGVNDSGGYCEQNPSHPSYPGTLNSVGLVNMSDIYYAWVNEVVTEVQQVLPDKKFALLAYQNVTDPPSFPLHPSVIPFITKDRMTWSDEEVRQIGHDQMEAWNLKADRFGWYDYMYGLHYLTPRVYPHLMAEALRFGADHGVIANYTEMYNNLGDGPKAWLAARLMWNPYQDEDALLAEWYERMVGPDAAEDLEAYYALWETFWTERVLPSSWFQNGKHSTYLPFNKASYVDLVTDADLQQSRALLENVALQAQTPKQQARAQVLLDAFAYTEAAVTSYPRRLQPPANASEALAFANTLDLRIDSAHAAADQLPQLIASYASNPALRFTATPSPRWSSWNPHLLWNLAEYVRANESGGGSVTDSIYGKTAAGYSQHTQDFARLTLSAATDATMTENDSFEDGSSAAANWQIWIKSVGTAVRSGDTARTGNSSLKIEEMERGGPNQTMAVQPGLAAAQAWYYTAPGTTTGGSVQMVWNLKGASGGTLATIASETIPLQDTAGEWASVRILEEIPSVVGQTPVTRVQLLLIVNQLESGTSVYVDDVVFYQ